MRQVAYTELRQNLARIMDEAVDSRAPILVTRQAGKGSVVILYRAGARGLAGNRPPSEQPGQCQAPTAVHTLRRYGRGDRARPDQG